MTRRRYLRTETAFLRATHKTIIALKHDSFGRGPAGEAGRALRSLQLFAEHYGIADVTSRPASEDVPASTIGADLAQAMAILYLPSVPVQHAHRHGLDWIHPLKEARQIVVRMVRRLLADNRWRSAALPALTAEVFGAPRPPAGGARPEVLTVLAAAA